MTQHVLARPRETRPKMRSTEEADYQKKITDLCDYLHLKWHHETDSRRSKKGFPDLLIAGPGGVLFVELKSEKGKVTADQADWLRKLHNAGAETHVWRPSDFTKAADRLKRLSRP